MITSYAQSGLGQRLLQRHRMLGKEKPQYCSAYADISQAEIGCPSGCSGFVAEQRKIYCLWLWTRPPTSR